MVIVLVIVRGCGLNQECVIPYGGIESSFEHEVYACCNIVRTWIERNIIKGSAVIGQLLINVRSRLALAFSFFLVT